MPGALIVLNNQGHITKVNERVIKLFGYTENELIGHSISMLFTPEDVPKLEKIEKSLIENFIYRKEKTCLNKKGESIQVLFSATKVFLRERFFTV